MIEGLETTFKALVEVSVMFLEIVGVLIILITSIKALVKLFKGHKSVSLYLSHGIATALTFLLGGEVLLTVTAGSWVRLGMVGATVILRIAITVLIHWETKHEKAEIKAEEEEEKAIVGGC